MVVSWLKNGYEVGRQAVDGFAEHRTRRMGAALAYYSLFALVPALFLAVAVAGLFFGQQEAETRIVEALGETLGRSAARQIGQAIDELDRGSATPVLAVASFVALLFSASVLFVAWKDSLDVIWDDPWEGGLLAGLRRRLFGFAVVLASGLLLSAVLFAEMVMGLVEELVDSPALDVVLRFLASTAPAVLAAVALALLYRWTPNTPAPWRAVWSGTLVAAIMASLAFWLYGLYLGTVATTSLTGAAGTVFVTVGLLYYTAQILLYGAEVTKVVSRRRAGAA